MSDQDAQQFRLMRFTDCLCVHKQHCDARFDLLHEVSSHANMSFEHRMKNYFNLLCDHEELF